MTVDAYTEEPLGNIVTLNTASLILWNSFVHFHHLGFQCLTTPLSLPSHCFSQSLRCDNFFLFYPSEEHFSSGTFHPRHSHSAYLKIINVLCLKKKASFIPSVTFLLSSALVTLYRNRERNMPLYIPRGKNLCLLSWNVQECASRFWL